MLSNKKILVDKPLSRPGRILHIADTDEFVTIRVVNASIDDEQIQYEPTEADVFRISVGENLSIWVKAKSIKDGMLLENFPISCEESIRVSASQHLVNKFLVFGWRE